MKQLSPIALPYAVFAPFLGSLVAPLLYRFFRRQITWIIALFPLFLFIYFISFLGQIDIVTESVRWDWVPFFQIGLTFSLSGLSLLMALLITGIGLIVVLYSHDYMSEEENLGTFFSYILFFLGAMLGVVTSDNLIALYLFWELTSVSSFLLIGFWHADEASRQGALKALMVTVLGGFALLISFVLLYTWGGSFEFAELVALKQAHGHGGLYVATVLLFFLGTWTKSAQAPFHLWLPGAMAAPTPVSAYLHSATMVKAGIFLTAKFVPLLSGTPLWYYGIATIGAVTVVLGAMLAIRQTDLKALLAFSTVSQLGLMISMFGMGTAGGSIAGTAHILNHALFKASLFLLVGIIDRQTGTREIPRLNGLARRMPVTAYLMIIAALSMAGVWPLNGFVSKELIFESLLQPPFGTNVWTILLAAMTVFGSALTTIYCLLMVHRIHFGTGRYDGAPRASDPPFPMAAGPVLLVSLVVILGLFPQLAQRSLIDAAASSVVGSLIQGHPQFIPHINLPFFMSIVALLLGFYGYTRLDVVQGVLARIKPRVHANLVYESILTGLDTLSKKMLRIHMTGFLRDYIVYIAVATVLVIGYALARGSLTSAAPDYAPIGFFELVTLVLICAAAVATVVAKRRLVAVATLGMVGMGMTMLYVFLRAPDLALTQFMVDAVSIVLILLAFRRLPPFWPENPERKKKRVDLIVAIASGVLVSSVALVANANRFFPSISRYFVENSLTLGGGTNIVNVILVDFRGFDTLGEITVLALAGLSVVALVKLRQGRKRP